MIISKVQEKYHLQEHINNKKNLIVIPISILNFAYYEKISTLLAY